MRVIYTSYPTLLLFFAGSSCALNKKSPAPPQAQLSFTYCFTTLSYSTATDGGFKYSRIFRSNIHLVSDTDLFVFPFGCAVTRIARNVNAARTLYNLVASSKAKNDILCTRSSPKRGIKHAQLSTPPTLRLFQWCDSSSGWAL